MDTPPPQTAPLRPDEAFPLGRAASLLGGGTLVMASAIYGGLLAFNQPLHARLNILAAVLCGGTGLVALLPVWLGSKTSSHGAAAGFMAGILVRMALTGGVVLYLQWGTDWPHARMLSFWVAGWYLAVLAVEVKLISSYVLAIAPGPPRYPAAREHSPTATAIPSAPARPAESP